jgi:hypothetical protein
MPQETVKAERASAIVVVENLVKKFGGFTALNDISLDVAKWSAGICFSSENS